MDTEEALRAALADAAQLRAHVEHAENERLYMSVGKQAAEATLALATERARAAEAEVERANSEETKMHGECAKAWAENTRLLAAHRAFGSYLAYVGVLCCPECSEMWGAAPDPEPDCCDESRAELRKASDAYAAALPASDKLAEGPPAPASDPLRGAAGTSSLNNGDAK